MWNRKKEFAKILPRDLQGHGATTHRGQPGCTSSPTVAVNTALPGCVTEVKENPTWCHQHGRYENCELLSTRCGGHQQAVLGYGKKKNTLADSIDDDYDTWRSSLSSAPQHCKTIAKETSFTTQELQTFDAFDSVRSCPRFLTSSM